MKNYKPLPSLSRVTPGATATLEIPRGPTYERIDFNVTASSGLDAADIGRINVLVNGKVVQTFKNLQRLLDLNSYYKRGADAMSGTAAQFSLHFFRRELTEHKMRMAPGIGTADIQTFHIEMEIASGAPASIAITANAKVDASVQPIGAFVHVKEYPYNSSVSGQVEVDKLIRGPLYAAIHLFKADISKVILETDGRIVIESSKTLLELDQKDASPSVRVPVTASATHVDFLTEGNLADALPTAGLQDMRLKITLDTSGAVDIVTETLDLME